MPAETIALTSTGLIFAKSDRQIAWSRGMGERPETRTKNGRVCCCPNIEHKESCVKKSSLVIAGIAGIMMTAFIGTSFAAMSDDREAVMKDVMKSFKVMIGISKSGQFDAAEVSKEAAAIVANLDKFKDLFPDGSQAGDSKAKAEIWTDRAGFEAARNNARDAAVNLGKVTDATAFKAAFDAQSAACKGCHDKYRAN